MNEELRMTSAKRKTRHISVIPAYAGIQVRSATDFAGLDSRLRGNDNGMHISALRAKQFLSVIPADAGIQGWDGEK